MIRTLLAATIICLATTACSESTQVSDDLAESSADLENPTGRAERIDDGPSAKPVRIGEGGPRFDACQSVWQTKITLEDGTLVAVVTQTQIVL